MKRKKKCIKLLVKVSKNRRWLGTVGKIVTLSYEDKAESQERRGGSVNAGRGLIIFLSWKRTS